MGNGETEAYCCGKTSIQTQGSSTVVLHKVLSCPLIYSRPTKFYTELGNLWPTLQMFFECDVLQPMTEEVMVKSAGQGSLNIRSCKVR